MSSTSATIAFHVSEQVAAAVAGGRPVVALESTIFTHGLPRPRNLDVALEAEERLRSQGVVPATIGVFAGAPTVGLSREQITSPIIVVSAGVKSILDVAATLERFETLNIPVVGYRTKKYPGFYVSDSGFAIEYAVNTPDEVAAVCRARDDLHIASAILLANPIAEDKQFPPAELDDILSRAWAQAEKNGINGKDTTPFLLDFIQRDTNGRSVNVNVEVYRSNVSLGGEVAMALTS